MRPTPIPPQPGQESVWDYPRPARMEEINKHLKVIFNDIVIAETFNGKRVLETSHPPTYYFPAEDVKFEYLSETSRKTFCEWKGRAIYYTVTVGDKKAVESVWRYPTPTSTFAGIADCCAFSARLMDECYVDGELVTPQPGGYYEGWITKDVVGPFKGGPGTMGW